MGLSESCYRNQVRRRWEGYRIDEGQFIVNSGNGKVAKELSGRDDGRSVSRVGYARLQVS
jgi:hypothetical protein